MHAGGGPSLLDRFLGVRDLVLQFDGGRVEETRWAAQQDGTRKAIVYRRARGAWKYGWRYAFMEMIVDPILVQWVPTYIVEQYERWNPYFKESLEQVLRGDVGKELCNRQVLRETMTSMKGKQLLALKAAQDNCQAAKL